MLGAFPLKLQYTRLSYTVISLHFDTIPIDVACTSFAQMVSDLKGCPKIGCLLYIIICVTLTLIS